MKTYAYVYVSVNDYYCCNTTDEVIQEFIDNGYGCCRTVDEFDNDVIKVSW